MKKALSLLLTVAMLLTMIAALTVSPVSAEEPATPERTPLKIELVSASTNLHNNTSTVVNWNGIFDPTSTTRHYARTSNDIEIVGKFEQPTQVTSVVLRNQFYRSRMNTVVVQFSVDGTNWTIGYTLQEVRDTPDVECDVEITTPGDDTLYNYIRIFKSKAVGEGSYSDGTKWIELDLQRVVAYNDGSNAKQLIQASTHKITSSDGLTNGDKFFDYYNTKLVQTGGSENPNNLIEGKLDKPTVLSEILVRYDGARMNGTIIKASVDGVTWNTLVTMNGQWGNANNSASQKIGHFHVNDTTAYNYIQIVRNHTLWGGKWQAYSIGFVGEELDVSNNLSYQTKIDADAWSLRLISTIDTLNCDAVGFEITATAAELAEAKAWDRNTTTVYTSICETVNGETVVRDAAYCGGNYIYTAVISGISIADYSAITFTVKPYVVIDGAKVYGATQTLVFNDGVAA